MYNKNQSQLPPVVGGLSSQKDIANLFMNVFKKNSVPNNAIQVEKLKGAFKVEYCNFVQKHRVACDCKTTYISVLEVIDALTSMKPGKCADEDEISVEHLHHAPLNVLTRVATLFNAMLKHSFVPKQFRSGFMIPLVKDQQGNHADTSNYRGITISPILSKLLEHVLKAVFCDHLLTSEYQYGYKKESSTIHAIHCLRETVNHYINHGSRVYCAFLDASKAFDRVDHAGLFSKLIHRSIPLAFLKLIMSWYNGMKCRVKWADSFSEWFEISAGVRQGGVLSPDLYSIYVDELLKKLEEAERGCHYYGILQQLYSTQMTWQ